MAEVSYKPPTKKLIVLLGIALVCLLLYEGLDWATQWGFEKELPRSARNVRVWVKTDPLLPDYSYYLRADMTAVDFQEYVNRLGAELHSEERVYEDQPSRLSWSLPTGVNLDWWTASKDLTATYVYQSGHTWTLVRYEDGSLFLKSHEH